jgi:hypothetical protein
MTEDRDRSVRSDRTPRATSISHETSNWLGWTSLHHSSTEIKAGASLFLVQNIKAPYDRSKPLVAIKSEVVPNLLKWIIHALGVSPVWNLQHYSRITQPFCWNAGTEIESNYPVWNFCFRIGSLQNACTGRKMCVPHHQVRSLCCLSKWRYGQVLARKGPAWTVKFTC